MRDDLTTPQGASEKVGDRSSPGAAEVAALEEQVRRLERALDARRYEAELDRQALEAALAENAVLRASTSWRVSAPLRSLGPVRTALQGPPGTRRSLRAKGGVQALARSVREQGLRRTALRVREQLAGPGHAADYGQWVQAHGELTGADRTAITAHVRELERPPTFTVVMAAYRPDPVVLRAAVASVTGQLYPHWQLVVCDDASPDATTWPLLEAAAATDPRIRVLRRETNGGITAATTDALAKATGEHVAFLDHDDVLAPHALYLVALELLRHTGTDLVYTDEDKLDAGGRRYEPHLKPAWNPDLLLAQNYLSHLTVVRRTLLERIGGMRPGFDGAQDHDLVLRASAATTPDRIRRVPFVLYSWRQHAASGSFSATRLEEAAAASRRAVAQHLEATGVRGAVVEPAPRAPWWNRVVFAVPDPAPAVTVVIPTRDRVALLRDCVTGLLERTDYPELRVLVVDNDSTDPDTLDYLEQLRGDPRADVLAAPGPFNYSALNNRAVEKATTPLVLLLNNDIVVREPGWLREMVSHACRPGVGVVGARLLYADERVQHAGVILGIGGVAGHSHKYAGPLTTGAFGRLVLAHDVSAVTGACLLVERELYLSVGGLDEVDLPIAFNDIDLCLKVKRAGQRVLWTPHAELYHLESASRGLEESAAQIARFNRESAVMRDRWGPVLRDDPAYNPNLSQVREDFSLASPPRVLTPWRDRR